MDKQISLKIGLFAPPIEEQLKDFNIEKEQLNKWEHISNFLFRQHINGKLTDKQMDKLMYALIGEIKNYINRRVNENG
jgi:hypothetical protein